MPPGHVPSAAQAVSPLGQPFIPLHSGGRSVIGSPGHSTHDVPPQSPPLHCWFGTLLDYRLDERHLRKLVPDLIAVPELRWLHR